MGQADIYAFLKKNRGERFTSFEIARGLNANLNTIGYNLLKLRRSKQIKYAEDFFSNSRLRYVHWID